MVGVIVRSRRAFEEWKRSNAGRGVDAKAILQTSDCQGYRFTALIELEPNDEVDYVVARSRVIPADIEQSHIAPEYRELHRWYVRTAEIGEYLTSHGEALAGPCGADLIGQVFALHAAVGELMGLLQRVVAVRNPALLDVWREASPK